MWASARKWGAGLRPIQCIWQDSGFAADQTNAMLATSNGGDKSSRNRESLRLLGITADAEEFSICGREIKCFFCWLLRNFSPFTQPFSAFQHGGGIITLGARFMPSKRWTPAGHGGLFAVFMPPRNLPRAGRTPTLSGYFPLRGAPSAHSGSHGQTRSVFAA